MQLHLSIIMILNLINLLVHVLSILLGLVGIVCYSGVSPVCSFKKLLKKENFFLFDDQYVVCFTLIPIFQIKYKLKYNPIRSFKIGS